MKFSTIRNIHILGGLIASMPSLDGSEEELYAIPGTPPDLLKPPKGDAFCTT